MNAVSGVVRLARSLDFSDANIIGITIIAEVMYAQKCTMAVIWHYYCCVG